MTSRVLATLAGLAAVMMMMMMMSGAPVGQRHLSQLFPELEAPGGTNTLVVLAIE